jgi:electron transport complex protein RnfD
MLSKITVSPAPHISQRLSTRGIMLDVIIGLAPAAIAAVWFFRLQAVWVIAACVFGCVVSEWLCNVIRKRENSLGDLSAVVTGLILAFSLPATAPWWMCIIGSAFAIVITKMLFGGLGANIFNPAMAARAFLTASFGMLMTTWTVPATVNADMPKISASNAVAVTQATPLAWAKSAIKGEADIKDVNALLKPAFLGNVGGCLGETSSLALIIGGIYLLIRRTITFHIPAAVLIAAFVFAEIFYLINPDKYSIPFLQLFSGGMLLCAFFIATDPVTAPLTAKGMWIFGAGVGALIMLIRFVGEYPEGVMYAVLLMNSVSPLIDRACKLIPAGGKPHDHS